MESWTRRCGPYRDRRWSSSAPVSDLLLFPMPKEAELVDWLALPMLARS